MFGGLDPTLCNAEYVLACGSRATAKRRFVNDLSEKEIGFVGARHCLARNAGIRRSISKRLVEERNPAVVPVRRRIQRAQRLLTLEIPDCECVKSPGLNLG